MDRNLNHRVEVVLLVETPTHIHHLRENVLEAHLRDNLRARIMHAVERTDVQEWLMTHSYNNKKPDAGRLF